jgi:hypothetical protein
MNKEEILNGITQNFYGLVTELLKTKACDDKDLRGQLIIIKSAIGCAGEKLLVPFYEVFDRHSDNIRALILTQDFSILDKIDTQNEVSKVQSDKADNIQFIINSIKNYSKDPEFKSHSTYFINKITELYKYYANYALLIHRK